MPGSVRRAALAQSSEERSTSGAFPSRRTRDNRQMTSSMPLRRPILALVLLALPALSFAQERRTFTLPIQVVSTTPTPALETAKGRMQCSMVDYPAAAARAHATGWTTVHVRIAPDGSVADVHLLRPAGTTHQHDLLDSATVESIRHRCSFMREPGASASGDQWLVMSFKWMLAAGGDPQRADAATLADLRERASHGDADAAFAFYMDAPYDPQSVPEAIQWLTFAAEHGVVRAQFELGRLHAIGEDVPQDLSQTVAWWSRAAANDSRDALLLADLLLDPQTPQHDAARATRLLEQAAAAHSSGAMLRLGDLPAAGTAGSRDDKAALAWWRRAAQEGRSGEALVRLGDAALAGRGTAPDRVEAATFYMMARWRNDIAGAEHLAAMQADDDTLAKASEHANRWHAEGESHLPD